MARRPSPMQSSEEGRGSVGAPRAAFRCRRALVRSWAGWSAVLCVVCLNADAAAQEAAVPGKLYRIIEGKVDARTYNGYRRYHAVCNHCHGPDGMGSSFGPSLVDHLLDIESFRRIVHDGQSSGAAVMKGFSGDPNVAPYVDDIYAYLQARADGELGGGRPVSFGE
jgi:mono/diheme cytochrome c family protein